MEEKVLEHGKATVVAIISHEIALLLTLHWSFTFPTWR